MQVLKEGTNRRVEFGGRKLNTITRELVRRYFSRLSSEGVAPGTVRKVHAVMSAILAEGVELGYLKVNPCAGVKGLPRAAHREMLPDVGIENTERHRDHDARGGEQRAGDQRGMAKGQRGRRARLRPRSPRAARLAGARLGRGLQGCAASGHRSSSASPASPAASPARSSSITSRAWARDCGARWPDT